MTRGVKGVIRTTVPWPGRAPQLHSGTTLAKGALTCQVTTPQRRIWRCKMETCFCLSVNRMDRSSVCRLTSMIFSLFSLRDHLDHKAAPRKDELFRDTFAPESFLFFRSYRRGFSGRTCPGVCTSALLLKACGWPTPSCRQDALFTLNCFFYNRASFGPRCPAIQLQRERRRRSLAAAHLPKSVKQVDYQVQSLSKNLLPVCCGGDPFYFQPPIRVRTVLLRALA